MTLDNLLVGAVSAATTTGRASFIEMTRTQVVNENELFCKAANAIYQLVQSSQLNDSERTYVVGVFDHNNMRLGFYVQHGYLMIETVASKNSPRYEEMILSLEDIHLLDRDDVIECIVEVIENLLYQTNEIDIRVRNEAIKKLQGLGVQTRETISEIPSTYKPEEPITVGQVLQADLVKPAENTIAHVGIRHVHFFAPKTLTA